MSEMTGWIGRVDLHQINYNAKTLVENFAELANSSVKRRSGINESHGAVSGPNSTPTGDGRTRGTNKSKNHSIPHSTSLRSIHVLGNKIRETD